MSTYTYNGVGTRVGKTTATGSNTYRRAGVGVTAPVLGDGAADYTPGISERRGGTTKFAHTDRLGSTSRLTNTTQMVTDTKSFDAFGMLVTSTGTTPTPFGFAGDWGYQTDTESGLQLLGHRYYDPSLGRFLTRDPIQSGRNWYGYCGNNPLKCVDPDGRQTVIVRGDDSDVFGADSGYPLSVPVENCTTSERRAGRKIHPSTSDGPAGPSRTRCIHCRSTSWFAGRFSSTG